MNITISKAEREVDDKGKVYGLNLVVRITDDSDNYEHSFSVTPEQSVEELIKIETEKAIVEFKKFAQAFQVTKTIEEARDIKELVITEEDGVVTITKQSINAL